MLRTMQQKFNKIAPPLAGIHNVIVIEVFFIHDNDTKMYNLLFLVDSYAYSLMFSVAETHTSIHL